MCAPAAMAIFGLAGAALQSVGTIQQANAQAAGMEAQAEWKERQAQVENVKTNFDIHQSQRNSQRVLSGVNVAAAHSGLEMSGTPMAVYEDTIRENALREDAIRFGGQEAQDKLNWDAKMDRMNAEQTKRAGGISAIAPFINFGSSLTTSLYRSKYG